MCNMNVTLTYRMSYSMKFERTYHPQEKDRCCNKLLGNIVTTMAAPAQYCEFR